MADLDELLKNKKPAMSMPDEPDDFMKALQRGLQKATSGYGETGNLVADAAKESGKEISASPQAKESFKAAIVNEAKPLGWKGELKDLTDRRLAESKAIFDETKGDVEALQAKSDSLYTKAAEGKKLTDKEQLGLALLTVIPTALGGLIGGKKGLAIGGGVGAASGAAGYKSMVDEKAETNKTLREQAKGYSDKADKNLERLKDMRLASNKEVFELEKEPLVLEAKHEFDSRLQAQKDANEYGRKKLDIDTNLGDKAAKKLLPDEKKTVETKAAKISNKLSIANSIDQAISQMEDPKLSEDVKIGLGRQLLKTLNSTEGADAIGSEEAKRLGTFLEYKFANFTGPGSFIGRDLDLFTEQAKETSKAIKGAAAQDKKEIDKIYSSYGIQRGNKDKQSARSLRDLTDEDISSMSDEELRSLAE